MSAPRRVVTVYLRSASGASLLAATPSELRRVDRFRATPDAVAAAEAALLALGLRVEARGVTLSASGDAALLAELFGLEGAAVGPQRAPRLPEALAPWVEAVELASAGLPLENSGRER